MDNRYFDRPKQVMFFEAENQEWISGIAYKDEIICACCGGIFNIDEVYELADDLGIENAVHPYDNWCSIKDEITGGELPSGLMYDKYNNIIEEETETEGSPEHKAHCCPDLTNEDVWRPLEENNCFPAD